MLPGHFHKVILPNVGHRQSAYLRNQAIYAAKVGPRRLTPPNVSVRRVLKRRRYFVTRGRTFAGDPRVCDGRNPSSSRRVCNVRADLKLTPIRPPTSDKPVAVAAPLSWRNKAVRLAHRSPSTSCE
jgi:hypothetical protein